MNSSTNAPVIQAAFEAALLDGLKGEPMTNKDGDLVTDRDGVMVMAAPEASFLSVVRAYLKDLRDLLGKPAVPQTGTAKGLLAAMGKPTSLPFGTRPQ